MENHLKEAFRLKNIVTLMMGLMFMAAGVSLSRIAELGTSPIASIPNVLSIHYAIVNWFFNYYFHDSLRRCRNYFFKEKIFNG